MSYPQLYLGWLKKNSYIFSKQIRGSYLVLAYQEGTSLSSTPVVDLFIPQAEPADLMWSVPPPTIEEASSTHEAKLYYLPALTSSIIDLRKAFPDAIIHTLPIGSPQFPALGENVTQLQLPIIDDYLLKAIHRARLTKTEFEITQIRKANEISSRAHEVVMRVLGKGVRGLIQRESGAAIERPLLPGEWNIEKEAEAEALFVASCRGEG